MKKKELLLAVILGLLVPELIFHIADKVYLMENAAPFQSTIAEPTKQTQVLIEETKQKEVDTVSVLMADGVVKRMVWNDYLTGVVAAEMPAEFEDEALKAQAVVARTYALKRQTEAIKHSQGAVCTDPACCQAYISREDYLAAGHAREDYEKVESVVLSTDGQVLTYQEELIEATYFSCSGGRTEDALAVWGMDVPYLRAVDSPGEENAAHYIDTVTFSSQEFQQLLDVELPGSTSSWIGEATYTAGGGVETITIGGEDFAGTQLRQLLGLRSTAFLMTAVGDSITVTTKGFGHRVGMSQYGADAMALEGSTYQQILMHYYPDTQLVNWDGF